MSAPTTHQEVNALIADCPRSGAGVHRWLFIAALRLRSSGLSDETAMADFIEVAAADCGRQVPRSEINSAVRDSGRPRETAAPRWPAFDRELFNTVSKPRTVEALTEMSPTRIDDMPSPQCALTALFGGLGDPFLCLAGDNTRFKTYPLSSWLNYPNLEKMQFIVPSPMSAKTGLTKDGRISERCETNVGPRRFLVTEFDSITKDEQCGVIMHLAKFAPLVVAVNSGGKSIHAWFYVAGQPADMVERFFRYAVSLGADSKLWTLCQLVRLPGGLRPPRSDGGTLKPSAKQTILFFRPEVIK